MWQRFTEEARKVVFHAQEQAQSCGDQFVGPEHLLLGILKERDGSACNLLEKLNVPIDELKSEVFKHMALVKEYRGNDMTLTPRAKRVIDLAYSEARNLKHDYIGAEHLVLGLICERDSLAARVLASFGAKLKEARLAAAGIEASQYQGEDTEKNQHHVRLHDLQRQATSLLFARQARFERELPFLTLLGHADGEVSRAFHEIAVEPVQAIAELEAAMLSAPAEGWPASSDASLDLLLRIATDCSAQLGEPISSRSLLLALLKDTDSLLVKVMSEHGFTAEACRLRFMNRDQS